VHDFSSTIPFACAVTRDDILKSSSSSGHTNFASRSCVDRQISSTILSIRAISCSVPLSRSWSTLNADAPEAIDECRAHNMSASGFSAEDIGTCRVSPRLKLKMNDSLPVDPGDVEEP